MTRTTTDVINDAINENSRGTVLLYVLASAFVIVGLSVIAHSAFDSGSVGEGFVGAIASSLCFPALAFSRRIRQENIMIRTLEIPLSNAATADDAARMLQLLMEKVFLREEE